MNPVLEDPASDYGVLFAAIFPSPLISNLLLIDDEEQETLWNKVNNLKLDKVIFMDSVKKASMCIGQIFLPNGASAASVTHYGNGFFATNAHVMHPRYVSQCFMRLWHVKTCEFVDVPLVDCWFSVRCHPPKNADEADTRKLDLCVFYLPNFKDYGIPGFATIIEEGDLKVDDIVFCFSAGSEPQEWQKWKLLWSCGKVTKTGISTHHSSVISPGSSGSPLFRIDYAKSSLVLAGINLGKKTDYIAITGCNVMNFFHSFVRLSHTNAFEYDVIRKDSVEVLRARLQLLGYNREEVAHFSLEACLQNIIEISKANINNLLNSPRMKSFKLTAWAWDVVIGCTDDDPQYASDLFGISGEFTYDLWIHYENMKAHVHSTGNYCKRDKEIFLANIFECIIRNAHEPFDCRTLDTFDPILQIRHAKCKPELEKEFHDPKRNVHFGGFYCSVTFPTSKVENFCGTFDNNQPHSEVQYVEHILYRVNHAIEKSKETVSSVQITIFQEKNPCKMCGKILFRLIGALSSFFGILENQIHLVVIYGEENAQNMWHCDDVPVVLEAINPKSELLASFKRKKQEKQELVAAKLKEKEAQAKRTKKEWNDPRKK
jgi:hypothetical protein